MQLLKFVVLVSTLSSALCGYTSMIEQTVSMPESLSDMTATTFTDIDYGDSDGYNHRIYIVGGCNSDQVCSDGTSLTYCYCSSVVNKCYYYKVQNKSWKVCATMPVPRYRHVAAKFRQYLYVAGGRDVSDNIVTSIYRLDTMTDTWSSLATWAGASSDGGAFASFNYIYFVGGYDFWYNQMATLVKFDTSTTVLTTMSSMGTPRGDISVAQIDDHAYVLGGFESNFCVPYNVSERYDISTNTWTVMPDMLYGRGDLASGVIGQHIFAIAGETKDSLTSCTYSVPVKNVGRYDVSTSSWHIEEDLNINVFRFTGASYNDSSTGTSVIYLFGGQSEISKTLPGYYIKDTTIKYTPYSTVSSTTTLDGVAIFGIVIGCLIGAAIIVIGAITYYAYARRGFYSKADIEMSKQQSLGDEVSEVISFNEPQMGRSPKAVTHDESNLYSTNI